MGDDRKIGAPGDDSEDLDPRKEQLVDFVDPEAVANICDATLLIRVRIDGHGGVALTVMPVFEATGIKQSSEVQVVAQDCALKSCGKFGEGGVVGETDLFEGGWSNGFVHGPDAMLPLGKMTNALLLENERVVAVDGLQFRRPMTANLRMIVAVDAIPEALAGEKESVLAGSFSTDRGRKLAFRAELCEAPVRGRSIANPYAHDIAHDFNDYEVDGDQLIFDLTQLTEAANGKFKRCLDNNTLGFGLNTFMDVVLDALTKVNPKRLNCLTQAGVLAAGLSNVRLGDLSKLGDGGDLKISLKPVSERRETTNGFIIIPFGFAILDKSKAEIASGVFTVAAPKTAEIMDRYMIARGL